MRRSLLLVALFASACGFRFERSSEVLDRRVLDIVADPPEIVGGAALPPSVRVSALVVDPGGVSVPVKFEWRTCLPSELDGGSSALPLPVADRITGRCSEDDAATLLASGEGPLDQLSIDVPVPREIGGILAAAAQQGVAIPIWVLAQLRIDSPQGPLYAYKRIVLSAPIPATRVANRNPVLSAVLFDGKVWNPDVPIEIPWNGCPESERVSVAAASGEVSLVCEHRLDPVFDADTEAEHYVEQALQFTKDTPRETIALREILQFTWFLDAGTVSRQVTSMPLEFEPAEYDPLSTKWQEPAVIPESRVANVWVVVRDGRGGSSWVQRQVRFLAP